MVCGEESLTYARARRAGPSRLARRLRRARRRARRCRWRLCARALAGADRGRSSASSRPAAPTCRSIRPTRRAPAFMLEDARRPVAGRARASSLPRCPRAAAAAGARQLDGAARPERRPPAAPRPAPDQPRLRHLHLGLDRPAQGGRRCAHRGVVRLVREHRRRSGLGPDEVCPPARAAGLRRLDAGDLGRRCSTAAGWRCSPPGDAVAGRARPRLVAARGDRALAHRRPLPPAGRGGAWRACRLGRQLLAGGDVLSPAQRAPGARRPARRRR